MGCPSGARWSASEYVDAAEKRGSSVVPDTLVTEVICENGNAVGVRGENVAGEEVEYYADAVILSAGGTRTPVILKKSGIEKAGNGLYVDTCYVAFGLTEDRRKRREFTVPFFFPEFHESEGFLALPLYYFHPAAFVVDYDAWHDKYYQSLNTSSMLEIGAKMRSWANKMDHVLAIMVKIKDEAAGEVLSDGRVRKGVTQKDQQKLDASYEWCKEMLVGSGCDPRTVGRGMLLGGHLGGTAATGQIVDDKFETYLVKNLFVCDLSVVPGDGLGMPPILLIVAFAKHFAKRLAKQL
jgi:choline dehydrogenase-like flavoprotein